MIDISFKFNGRRVRPDRIGKELDRAVFDSVKKDVLAYVKKQTRGIRDPKTGAAPLLRFKGNMLDKLSVEVIGSEEVLKLVEDSVC